MLDLLNLPGVKPVDLHIEQNAITVVAEVVDSATPVCPECGRPLYRHGKRVNVFADTPMQMHPVRLEVLRPRYRCEDCGKIITPDLEFLDERRRATQRLINTIRKRCLSTTFHGLAQETGLAVNTIKNISLDLVEELELTVRYETPIIMGIDVVNLAGGYRCIITNLATHNVFQMLEHRTQAHLKSFFEKLPDRDKVEWVCTDMWRPLKASFGPYLPNAKLIIDRFHVEKIATEALDAERKKYQSALSDDDQVKVKKSVLWITLKRPSFLTAAEKEALSVVRANIPALAEAYDLKEIFYCIYDCPDKESAIKAFYDWKQQLPKNGFESFHKLAKTVENHFNNIFAYWDCPQRITNAFTKSVNGLAKIANRMGRGYSYDIIRAKILYAKEARKVGSGVLPKSMVKGAPTRGPTPSVEYGPHIPTLVKMSEEGELD